MRLLLDTHIFLWYISAHYTAIRSTGCWSHRRCNTG